MDRLKIVTICGCGVGSSIMLKINIEEILNRYNIKADIVAADVTTAYAEAADIIVTQPTFSHALKSATYKEVVFLNNFASKKELEEKLVPVLKKLGLIS
ncbi:MAG: PTS sugar transporter subunit IIB [Candidatus Asgardarchaeia archaeon]